MGHHHGRRRSLSTARGKFTFKIPEYGHDVGEFQVKAINTKLVNLPFVYSYEAEATEK